MKYTFNELYHSSVLANMVGWDTAINPTNVTRKVADEVSIQHDLNLKKFIKDNPDSNISHYNSPLMIDDDLQEQMTLDVTKLWTKYLTMRSDKSLADDEYFDAFDKVVDTYRRVLDSKGASSNPLFFSDSILGEPDVIMDVIKRMVDISSSIIKNGNAARNPYTPTDDHDIDAFIERFNDVSMVISNANGSFMTPIDVDNARIHVKDREDEFNTRSSVYHEVGHALYQNRILRNTSIGKIGQHPSLSLHESSAIFHEISLGGIESDISDGNKNKFRIGSDKLHYIIHIYIRMLVEEQLLSGKISSREIPELWSNLLEQYTGMVPENDWEGFLQDVHWNSGGFGYFHSYAIGFFNAACMFQDIRDELSGDAYRDAVDVILPHIEDSYGRFNEYDSDLFNIIHPDLDASMEKYYNFVLDVFSRT